MVRREKETERAIEWEREKAEIQSIGKERSERKDLFTKSLINNADEFQDPINGNQSQTEKHDENITGGSRSGKSNRVLTHHPNIRSERCRKKCSE